ncbi:MAG: hypothetical protein K1X53_03395 [Candidatus Sumerlaeaceae bacterium]|nr:hypothetical protein [Candidatus Sumerlaeaceae bacterium]
MNRRVSSFTRCLTAALLWPAAHSFAAAPLSPDGAWAGTDQPSPQKALVAQEWIRPERYQLHGFNAVPVETPLFHVE